MSAKGVNRSMKKSNYETADHISVSERSKQEMVKGFIVRKKLIQRIDLALADKKTNKNK
jgi:hypothetical protein